MAWGCGVSCGFYKSKGKIKFYPGEQYFLTLIHEIGRFKIRLKAPKKYEEIRRKMMRENPELDVEEQMYLAEDYIKKKNKEIDKKYFGRVNNFRSWLGGDYDSEHIKIED